MNSKHFIINPNSTPLSKEDIQSIEKEKQTVLKKGYDNKLSKTENRKTTEQVKLKHVYGRIIIQIDIDSKNVHTFESGEKIYIDRQVKNLDRKHTEPINATVIDAEYIPAGSEILIHPNSIVDANKIFNYSTDVTIEAANSIRYYSIEEISAFIYREGNQWLPLKGFATALRVFKPYIGTLKNIPHQQLKNVLYITSGELKGKVCHTLKAADYELIFMDVNGRENRLIRCRHFEGKSHDREEIVATDHFLTKQINDGELLVGISLSDCKTLDEHYG